MATDILYRIFNILSLVLQNRNFCLIESQKYSAKIKQRFQLKITGVNNQWFRTTYASHACDATQEESNP